MQIPTNTNQGPIEPGQPSHTLRPLRHTSLIPATDAERIHSAKPMVGTRLPSTASINLAICKNLSGSARHGGLNNPKDRLKWWKQT